MSGKVITLDGLHNKKGEDIERSMSLPGAYSEGVFELVKWAAMILGLGIVHHIISHVGNGVTAKVFGTKE